MKKLLLLFTASLFLVSCSNEQKAKKAIRVYLSKNINDFKSYEPVEYGDLDGIFNNKYEKMLDAEMIIKDSIIFQRKVYEYKFENTDSLEKYTALLADAVEKLQLGTKDHEHKLIGFEQYHKFRAKNSFGATVMRIGLFTFDPELKRVTKYEGN